MRITKHFNIPIFIPELACPNRCVFCNQYRISGAVTQPIDEEIIRTIESHLESINKKDNAKEIEIAFFGGNFTGIPIPQQEHYLKLVQPYLKSHAVKSIRLSTRPDYINEPTVAMLKSYGVGMIELGVQSMDEDVLKASGRGYEMSQVFSAIRIIKEYTISLGLQMMIGLPGDTLDKSKFTAQQIIALAPAITRIYPTVVIRDTELEQLYNKGLYHPLTLEEAIEWTKEIYLMFEEANIKVIRTGLHPSEDLTNGNSMLAGPFHISFKELVMTRIWKDIFEKHIFDTTYSTIEITVPTSEINFAIGYGGVNKKILQTKFKRVTFISSPEIIERRFYVHYC